jgi:hypothetical protein
MSFERVRPGGAGRKRRRPGRGRPNPRGRPGEAAGKQATLGRLEYSPETVHQTDRYHQITAKADRIGELFAEDLEKPEGPIVLDLDATHEPTARRLGGEVFPRILRLLLLSTPVHLLQRGASLREAPAIKYRSVGRDASKAQANRGGDPPEVAGDRDHSSGRQRVCSGTNHEGV